jgi:hypothetical protein
MHKFWQKTSWDTFWAIFSQTHLVTLPATEFFSSFFRRQISMHRTINGLIEKKLIRLVTWLTSRVRWSHKRNKTLNPGLKKSKASQRPDNPKAIFFPSVQSLALSEFLISLSFLISLFPSPSQQRNLSFAAFGSQSYKHLTRRSAFVTAEMCKQCQMCHFRKTKTKWDRCQTARPEMSGKSDQNVPKINQY